MAHKILVPGDVKPTIIWDLTGSQNKKKKKFQMYIQYETRLSAKIIKIFQMYIAND